jgi:urease accessory protein UreH
MIPDHTVCFEDANYKQEQIYNLITSNCNDDDNGSLVLVDWISSGRKHGGRKESSSSEIWKLKQLRSTVKLMDKQKCLFLDNIHLFDSYDDDNDNVTISIEDKVGGASIFGLVVLFGPKTSLLRDRVSVLMQRQSFQNKRELTNNSNDNSSKSTKFFYSEPLVSVSVLSSSLVVLRFASECVESAYVFVKEVLRPLGKEMGFEPYADKIRTVEDHDWHCLKELRNYDSKSVVT